MRARRASDVVLIDAITTDADRADEHAMAIQSKRTWKNRDPVRKLRVRHKHGIRRDAGETDATSRQLDEEQHVEALQEQRVDSEEVASRNLYRLLEHGAPLAT